MADQELGPGLYEALLTGALDKRLASLVSAVMSPELRNLADAEAADRLSRHLAAIVTRAIEALPEHGRAQAGASIVEKLIERIRSGLRMGELAAIGDKAVAEFGGVKDQAAEKWPHYGHGLGLFFEKPYISTVMGTEDVAFAAGMVMGVEAFLSTPGVGSAGFEQNVIVTQTGAEVITPAPSVWW